MRKRKVYKKVKFSARIVRAAIAKCEVLTGNPPTYSSFDVHYDDEGWEFDDLDEFLSYYARDNSTYADVDVDWHESKVKLYVGLQETQTVVRVTAPNRQTIESVFSIFEEAAANDKQALDPEIPKDEVCIFIGHGRSSEWTKLKSHLQDKHGLEVEAYETGARAGHVIRDILESMAEKSSFALLVLTGEDKAEDGLRARQNVVHECGLFQGYLGFDRAILLVEEGVELASNLDGVQQLRFEKGRISEVFGDVIATIRREFGPI